MTDEDYYGTEENFKELLVGRKVKEIKDLTLVLDNGTEIELIDSVDCCSWFTPSISNYDLLQSNHIITDVTTTENTDDSPDGFTLHILSEAMPLFDIQIEGDASNGYYLHSIYLDIKKPEEERCTTTHQ